MLSDPAAVSSGHRHSRPPTVAFQVFDPVGLRMSTHEAQSLHLRYGPPIALPTLSSCRYLHKPKARSPVGWLGPLPGREFHPLDAPSLAWRAEYVLHLCDVILVMTVNPGFGGQAFLPEMLPKIRRIRAICAERGLNPIIEVDGGQNAMTAAQAAAGGATAIVAGSAIFGTSDYKSAIAAIRASAAAAEVEP